MPPVFNISLEAILRGCDKSLDSLKGNSMENPWEFSPWNPVKHCPLKQQTIEPVFFASDHSFLDVDQLWPRPKSPQAAKAIEKLGKLWSTDQPWLLGSTLFWAKALPKMGGSYEFFCVLSSNLLRLSCLRVQNCGKDPIGSVSSRPRWVWRSCQLDEIITLPGFLCHSPYQTTLTFNWGQFTPRNREWLEMGGRFST